MMLQFSISKLKDLQRKVTNAVKTDDILDDIKTIAGFDITYNGDQCVCAAVVLSYPDLKIIESTHVVSKVPMNYIPGLLAFREGPVIMEAYYSLETEPDVLMIDGHGISHPEKCGVASFVGVELGKPTFGVAKKTLAGEIVDNKIIIDNEERGILVKTREYANPVVVSPGHFISMETAATIVQQSIVPPHKMPEPVHIARRFSAKQAKKIKESEPNPAVQSEPQPGTIQE